MGDRVAIELRGIGALAGSVVWRVENRIGIAFDQRDRSAARAQVGGPARSPQPAGAAGRAEPAPRRRPKLFGE